MNLGVALRFAGAGVAANKMRSLLTMLGILIGVAAVIILLAVGTGSSAAVKKNLSQLGTDTLTVNRSAAGNGRAGTGAGFGAGGFGGGFGGAARAGGTAGTSTGSRTSGTNLTLDDAEALTDKDTAPDVRLVAPVASASSVSAVYTGVTHALSSYVGTTPSYFVVNNDTFSSGSSFSDDDYLQRRAVIVIGSTVASDLFGTESPIDKTIQLNGKDFTVVGILKSKGSTGNTDQDDVAMSPLTTVQDDFVGTTTSLTSISVNAMSSSKVTAAIAEIESVLDGRHKVTSSSRDYTVRNQSAILQTATSTSHTLTVLLGAVAAISLLVGGIGVMNIMLVTVTERTREIGIRKAIGAGRADIVVQFLAEAVLLSLLGAVLGIVVGIVGSQFTIVGIEPVIAPWSVALAFGVAVAVGLFFGIYPANRAASLKPIDALRYE